MKTYVGPITEDDEPQRYHVVADGDELVGIDEQVIVERLMEPFNEIVDRSDRAFNHACECEGSQAAFVVFVRVLVVNGHRVDVVPARVSDELCNMNQFDLLSQHCLVLKRHTLRQIAHEHKQVAQFSWHIGIEAR